MILYKKPNLISFYQQMAEGACGVGSGNTTVDGCHTGPSNSGDICGSGGSPFAGPCAAGVGNTGLNCNSGTGAE